MEDRREAERDARAGQALLDRVRRQDMQASDGPSHVQEKEYAAQDLPPVERAQPRIEQPAVKPIALRCVYQAASTVDIPIVGIGGIASVDDVMEFLVAGATAVQIGTANFYNPTVSLRILDLLPDALAGLNADRVEQVVGTLDAGGT